MSSGNYPVIIIKGEDELFFCEVFPETDGEVLAVQFRIDTFFDGDGFKVGSPELLKKLFIFCHQLLIQFAGQKMGSFGFETDFIDFLPIVIITVFPFDIIQQPALVGESVLKVTDNQRQYIVYRFEGGKISSVDGFLKTGIGQPVDVRSPLS